MTNPLLMSDQLLDATDELPEPVGPPGRAVKVEVTSLARHIGAVAKAETVEFQLREVIIGDCAPSLVWEFKGGIHIDEFDTADTDALQLLIEVATTAKQLRIEARHVDRVEVTAYFRQRSERAA